MTVYTVSSTDDLMSSPLDTNVEGSYTNRGAALDACVAYIFWRMELRDDLVWAMAHDENHPEARRFFVEHRDGTIGVRKGFVNKLKEFVRDVLGGDGNYNVYDGADFTMHFEVQESELKGDCWHLVTWGDSDCEDPDFTTPFPELSTDEDKAVANAVQYARDLMDARGYKASGRDHIAKFIGEYLKANGQARLDLDDGAAVHWVLYHFGMETENTDGK